MTRRIFLHGVSAVALAVVAGCATLPSPEVMRAEVANFELPRTPAADKAMVYVVRPSELGGLVRFNVFLGDQEPGSEMGFTRGGQYIYFNVPLGRQRVYSKAENTADVEIDAKRGEVIFLQQEPTMGILFARNSLLRIEELPGKYHVKTLKPGTTVKTDK